MADRSIDGSYEGDDAEAMKGSYDAFYEGIGALVMGSATLQGSSTRSDEWPYAGKPSGCSARGTCVSRQVRTTAG